MVRCCGMKQHQLDMMFDIRTMQLIGADKQRLLHSSSILLVGLGGVGGFALEVIARCGIQACTLVDGDRFSISNLNRQLLADLESVGQQKTVVAADRIKRISPQTGVLGLNMTVTPENVHLLDVGSYDVVVDAIDTVPAKLALLTACQEAGVPVFSSMGAAGKLDPTLVKVSTLEKAHGCPLARKLRKQLRKNGSHTDISVVYSPEPVGGCQGDFFDKQEDGDGRRPLGTISYMPAQFGILLGYAVIQYLMKREEVSGTL